MTDVRKTVKLLSEKKLKIATAESCTGGLVSQMITGVSGSSNVFDCGIVSYSNSIKESVLGVKHSTLETFGAVSEQTVIEMAEGVRRISNADICVAVSGIAGPNSDDTNKPVGLIWLAFNINGKTITKKLENKFDGDVRTKNRQSAADTVFKTVIELLG